MGPIFWLSPNFWVFAPQKLQNLWKIGPVFQEKSLTMGILFCENDP